MGMVLSNGSLSSQTSGEGEIRQNMLEADLIDCIVMLPKQLFYNTGIPACLWFLTRNKHNDGHRERKGEVLFIDAGEMGHLIDRVHRTFSDEDIAKITETYHKWKSKEGGYEDVKGFCKSVNLEEIKKHKYVLTPGGYVGIPDEVDDGVSFEEKMEKLTGELREQMKEGRELDDEIKKNLEGLGFKI